MIEFVDDVFDLFQSCNLDLEGLVHC